jgi:hypothetical protein
MAFPSANGYTQLGNGNFSPVIYSKKVQKTFRNSSVVEGVTNTDYFGEIANEGDSVRIIKEPQIDVVDYKRGTALTSQALDDADFTLVIDKANAFQFQVDDIETAHSHVNFIDLATDNAAYKLRDAFDQEVLGYLSGWEKDGGGLYIPRTTLPGTKQDSTAGNDELLAANKLTITSFGGTALTSGDPPVALTTSIPLAPGGGAGAITSPLALMNRMARLLDQRNVDTEDRWFVADPVFYELLMDEDSKLINNDYASSQNAGGILRNGKIGSGSVRGFNMHKSNNLPFIGTGPGTTASNGSATNFGVIVAGHKSAVATAQQIAKTESFRSPSTFADVVRGLHLYGRKILRSESLIVAYYNVA